MHPKASQPEIAKYYKMTTQFSLPYGDTKRQLSLFTHFYTDKEPMRGRKLSSCTDFGKNNHPLSLKDGIDRRLKDNIDEATLCEIIEGIGYDGLVAQEEPLLTTQFDGMDPHYLISVCPLNNNTANIEQRQFAYMDEKLEEMKSLLSIACPNGLLVRCEVTPQQITSFYIFAAPNIGNLSGIVDDASWKLPERGDNNTHYYFLLHPRTFKESQDPCQHIDLPWHEDSQMRFYVSLFDASGRTIPTRSGKRNRKAS